MNAKKRKVSRKFELKKRDPDHPTLGEIIYGARRNAGFGQGDLGCVIRCSQSLVSKFESDLVEPNAAMFMRLMRFLVLHDFGPQVSAFIQREWIGDGKAKT